MKIESDGKTVKLERREARAVNETARLARLLGRLGVLEVEDAQAIIDFEKRFVPADESAEDDETVDEPAE